MVEQAKEVKLDRPAFRGFSFLAEEFLSRTNVAPKRGEIDWEQVAWESFGFTTTNKLNGQTHLGQVKVFNAAFKEQKKVIFIRAGKRSGKTISCLNIAKIFHKVVPGARGWVASSTYALADMIFNPLFDTLVSGVCGDPTDKSRKDRRVRLPGGGLAQAKSWDDQDSLEGESLDYLICDEGQSLDQHRFDLLYARTVDRNGVFLIIGSPASDDTWFLGMCEEAKTRPSWAYIEWTIWDNPFNDPEDIRQAQENLSPDSFREMFENQVRTPQNLVFQREYDQKLSLFRDEPDPRLPLYVAIDPGTTASAYAVAFLQIVPPDGKYRPVEEVRVFDEVYEHYTFSDKILEEQVLQHRYWHQVVSGVMDTAGRQHHDRLESPKEVWQAKAHIPIYDRKVDIQMGTERMKGFLLQPGTNFRRLKLHERCVNLQREFMNYRYSKSDNPMLGARRLPIDNFNHLIKAVTYFLVWHYGYYDKRLAGKGRKWHEDR